MRIEPLERRQLLTTLLVTSAADTVAVDGTVTLREALGAANTNKRVGDAPAGSPGLDIIRFNLPGTGVHTIYPRTALPSIAPGEPVTINGYSQRGSRQNTLTVGSDALITIRLIGSQIRSGSANGLTVEAAGTTIYGLAIDQFPGHGIESRIGPAPETTNPQFGLKLFGSQIGSTADVTKPGGNGGVGIYLADAYLAVSRHMIGGNFTIDRNIISRNTGGGIASEYAGGSNILQITNNYIGTDASGRYDRGNGSHGIRFSAVAKVSKNVISGNSGAGITGGEDANIEIYGNYIGTNATGTADVGNDGDGIGLSYTYNALIGGTTTDRRNVISGNGGNGITLDNTVATRIEGNYVGTNAKGTAIIRNAGAGVRMKNGTSETIVGGGAAGAGNLIAGNGTDGIYIGGGGIANRIVGGTAPAAQNVISGNGRHGIYIVTEGNFPTSKNVVLANRVGRDPRLAASAVNAGNRGDGIRIEDSSGNMIGQGTSASQGNYIAYNGGAGIAVVGNGSTGNQLQSNRTEANRRLGIDLQANGITANDATDADAGPNGFQNAPIFLSAVTRNRTLQITGRFTSKPDSAYTVQLFRSPWGMTGEGAVLLNTIVTRTRTTSGVSTFTLTVPNPRPSVLTATVTGHEGTSEYSRYLVVR